MAPVTDPKILATFQQALDEGRRFSGYVTWKPRAQEWVRKELPNVTLRTIVESLHQHVHSGGEIDGSRETRPEWRDFQFHFDFRLLIEGRWLYVETVVLSDDPDDPEVQIVNIHDV